MSGVPLTTPAVLEPATTRRALWSPLVDALAAGGGSLAVFGAFWLVDPAKAGPLMMSWFVPLSLLLNWPHFMASYHLLYTMPGAVAKHPFATKIVPAGLALCGVAALAVYARVPLPLQVLHGAAAVYLAWHYTGQAWGTMAVFASLAGARFDDASRRLVRGNLYALLAFHAVWSAHLVARWLGPYHFNALYQLVSFVAAASSLAGAAGLRRLYRASGRLPAGVVFPWLAIHAWYALLYRYPTALYWVQLAQMSHASQYMIFPLRVQANRAGPDEGRAPTLAGRAVYFAALAASGFAAFYLLPRAADLAAARVAWPIPAGLAGIVVGDLLAIHHYFVDGCIWKLRSAEVRRDLFRHLEPA